MQKRRETKIEQLMKKQAPPSFARKTSFLLKIEAYDVAKLEHSWKQGIGCKTTKELVTLDVVKGDKQTKTKKTNKTKKTKKTKKTNKIKDQTNRTKFFETRSKKPKK